MSKKIFVACDTTNLNKVRKIINYTQSTNLKIGYKFGLEFFYSKSGRFFLSKINKKQTIFLDLKLNDIPNTCISAVSSLKDLKNIKYLTVHINGGFEMLKAIKNEAKKINKKLKILGVTVLTSFSDQSLKKTGHTRSVKNLVIHQAKIAKSVGLDGIVCSAKEARLVKKICKNMEIITPGIRLPGDNVQDQNKNRVVSPKSAFNNGATAIVIGRSITEGSIKNNLQKLIKSLN
jgi:orotidine-5'-phosphate decarboxylase